MFDYSCNGQETFTFSACPKRSSNAILSAPIPEYWVLTLIIPEYWVLTLSMFLEVKLGENPICLFVLYQYNEDGIQI